MTERMLVVAAIIVDDLAAPTRVLAARRTGPLSGWWEFPGGKVESGEMPEAALVRELLEELGVHTTLGVELIRPSGELWPISDVLDMRLWFATIDVDMPEPIDSHDELRWLDAGSLRSVAWLDADLVVVPYVFALVEDARQRAGDLASARNSTDLDYLAGN